MVHHGLMEGLKRGGSWRVEEMRREWCIYWQNSGEVSVVVRGQGVPQSRKFEEFEESLENEDAAIPNRERAVRLHGVKIGKTG